MVEGDGTVIAPLAQSRVDLVAVHAARAAGDDLGLDALRFAPLAPFRPAALRQQVGLRAALQIPVVILPERLRAGAVMAVEITHPVETSPTGRPSPLRIAAIKNRHF